MILETARLILRPWEDRDRPLFADFVADPEVMRFYPRPKTRKEADAWIDANIAGLARGTNAFLAAERKSDGAFMGLIGSAEFSFTLPGNPRREIGWLLGRAFWGQGYAPEGARASLDHAFGVLGLPEIVAFTYHGNLPSQRVMQKLGMTRDPADDFDHPNIPEGDPIRPHVLYRVRNPAG
jgi:RimJ/RimL family protein N-acetyltransferase